MKTVQDPNSDVQHYNTGFIAAYATEIPLSRTYSFHLSHQTQHKKSALTKHRPITVQTACSSKSTLHKAKTA